MNGYLNIETARRARVNFMGRASCLPFLAALLAVPAHAQEAPADEAAEPVDIVVTGSRLKSSFEQPTPVAIKTIEDLKSAQPTGVALSLIQSPQFAGSSTSRTLPTSSPTQLRGSYLNLRGLGASRTLILQDGDRVPPTSFDGLVDVEIIPELLVSRVDVVTAGVSAVYGSDAVSGVVNYIIDDKFTGLKLTGQTGVSTYGDAFRYDVGAAAGLKFAEGRGHVLLSVEHEKSDEIQYNSRPEFNRLPGFGGLGTAASPYTLREGVVWGSIARFPYIAAGPFAGRTFNADGSAAFLNPGTSIGAVQGTGQIGGTGSVVPPERSLLTGGKSTRFYGRVSYDLTNDIKAFVEGSYAANESRFQTALNFAGYLPLNGNPYLAATGIALPTQFVPNGSPIGFIVYTGDEFGPPKVLQKSDAWNIKAGLTGELGAGWNFRATYVHGQVEQHSESRELNNQHLFASLDTVSTPGGPACYVSTLPNNPLPGCLPYNPYGSQLSQNIPGLRDWLFSDSVYDVTNKMDVFSANVSGSPFELPAGPVSVSLNAEYRENSLVRTSNSDPAIPLDTLGGAIRGGNGTTRFGVTNIGVIDGRNNVKEAGLEVLVPIVAPDSSIGELSVSGAGRWTDYSNSGTVYTWKAGGIWQPADAVRFRVTRSRDIRAPNLFELFAGRTAAFTNFTAPAPFSTAGVTILISGGGNAALKPEVANTLTFGAVFQPVNNFTISADYYDIDLNKAIQERPAATLVGDCASSGFTSPACANVTVTGGGNPTAAQVGTAPVITGIFSGPVNLANLRTRGIDFDASYVVPLGNGQLNLRANANVLLSFKSQTSASAPVVSQAGYIDGPNSLLLQDAIQPKFRSNVSARYTADGGLNLFLQARYIGKLNQGEVPGLAAGQTFVYAQKTIPSVVYVDANISQTIKSGPFGGELVLFANVNNLFNRRPPVIPNAQQPTNTYPTYANLYDIMGRYFTVGATIRF